VSQDAGDFSRWVLTQLERDGSFHRGIFGVNLYYSKGQGFGGSERYTLATTEHGLQQWGVVLPKSAWPAIKASFSSAGAAWQGKLAESLKAMNEKVLTPRISRSRPIKEFADVSPGGEDMYIPDHGLEYKSRAFILVPRHT